jgi:DNA-binding CsgD family transcriptional regulator
VHFREATPGDIGDIVATLGQTNALPMSPRLQAALPDLLPKLMASAASPVMVFEGRAHGSERFFSWGATLFVQPAVIESYLAAPRPALAAHVLESLLDGARPLLSFDEIRRANSGPGLNAIVVPLPLGHLPWQHPTLDELRRAAPLAFIASIGGYRLQAIYYEVFTSAVADYVEHGGYKRLHDFASAAGSGFIPPDAAPHMLRLSRGDLPAGAMSFATQLFHPPAPQLRLSPAEQRVALKALAGAPDRAIADALGLSLETVRTHWQAIYARLAGVTADFAERETPPTATRGPERRRLAVEYLRQHMHELRPHL